MGSADQPSAASEHLLTGRIWDTARGIFVAQEAVEREPARAEFVLLGERHGHPEHHRLQVSLLRAMTATGRRPAVVFEMLPENRQGALDRYLARRPRDAAGIGAALGWEERGWPPWALYQPIAQATLDAGLRLRAGGLPDQTLQDMRREGLAGLPEDRRRRLNLDRPLPEKMALALRRELSSTHRWLLSERALNTLVSIQRAQDAVLADNLLRALTLDGVDSAVLIAGTGHVRADRDVPFYLSKLAPKQHVLGLWSMLVYGVRRRLGPRCLEPPRHHGT